MCGRFSFSATKVKIKDQLGEEIETGENLLANYNIAPTQQSYVITNEQPKLLQYFSWGLIPHWAKDKKIRSKLINARSEGIEAKPSFRNSIRRRRCLVLADSFYEWRKEGGKKIPYRILPNNGDLLVMAGIWEVWRKEELPLSTFSIITTPPNKEMIPIHNRMPVLLTSKAEVEQWLGDISLEEVQALLKTPQDDILKIYRVSEQVNSVKNNSPELHNEIPGQTSLFD